MEMGVVTGKEWRTSDWSGSRKVSERREEVGEEGEEVGALLDDESESDKDESVSRASGEV